MYKIIAFIGSQRKGITYKAVQEFEKNLKELDDIDFEYIFLSDFNLEFCRGCKLCFDKGEQYCPIKDDKNLLMNKLEQADGVIFATPSYAFQVSARMKNFIDRITYTFHRPRFFGKVFTAMVIHAVPVGAGKIQKYLESTGSNAGFEIVKGCCINSMEPMSEKQQNSLNVKTKKLSKRFYKQMVIHKKSVPSLFRLMTFRMTRSGLQACSDKYYDYYYYRDKGWFNTGYYYETTLSPVKKLFGYLFDMLGYRMFKSK